MEVFPENRGVEYSIVERMCASILLYLVDCFLKVIPDLCLLQIRIGLTGEQDESRIKEGMWGGTANTKGLEKPWKPTTVEASKLYSHMKGNVVTILWGIQYPN